MTTNVTIRNNGPNEVEICRKEPSTGSSLGTPTRLGVGAAETFCVHSTQDLSVNELGSPTS